MDGFATNLRQLPDASSQTVMTLLGGMTVDVLAVTEDKEWVQVAYWEGGSQARGWLQVDTLELNISLDDLKVATETEFVQSTNTPGPIRTPKQGAADPLVEYGAALLPLVLPLWAEGMTQVGVLSSAASENVGLMSDAGWRTNMIIAFVQVQLANDTLREIDVPEEAWEVHNVLLDAAVELDLMMQLISAAADELDTDKIITATEAMERAAEHIDRANDLLP